LNRPSATGASHDRACAIIPALDAAKSIESVVTGSLRHLRAVLVVDDGSRDDTAERAERAGATVIRHERNRGKGAALKSGLSWARAHGYEMAVSLDADGQHPPDQLPRMLEASADPEALVLGIRNLARAGAPRPNQLSNAFSNWFLSHASRFHLRDTQCGLRRYPVRRTLGLGVQDDAFGFEAEVLLRAVRAKIPIVQVDVQVLYPSDRTTHFDSRRDPWRIVGRVLRTMIRK
jgi:glycosyltransferase involved in cell wall biosynthesis